MWGRHHHLSVDPIRVGYNTRITIFTFLTADKYYNNQPSNLAARPTAGSILVEAGGYLRGGGGGVTRHPKRKWGIGEPLKTSQPLVKNLNQ